MSHDRSAFAPRTSRQEEAARKAAEMREDIREEIRALHIEMGIADAVTPAQFDDLVEDTFRERSGPHPSLTPGERQR